MTLHWCSFQVFSFDNYVDDTPTEIDLKPSLIKTVVHDLGARVTPPLPNNYMSCPQLLSSPVLGHCLRSRHIVMQKRYDANATANVELENACSEALGLSLLSYYE